MSWSDRSSRLPVIILDECIYSPKLQEHLSNMGYNVLFLGSGLADQAIRDYMRSNPKTVLITADQEFDAWFSWRQSLLIQQTMPTHEMVVVIAAFMSVHKGDAQK